MPRKISELSKELGISVDELKGYAEQLGIKVTSEKSTVKDEDLGRLTTTVNMMLGKSSNDNSGKPKAKAPAAKAVIPKKEVVIPKKTEEEPKKIEEEQKKIKEE